MAKVPHKPQTEGVGQLLEQLFGPIPFPTSTAIRGGIPEGLTKVFHGTIKDIRRFRPLLEQLAVDPGSDLGIHVTPNPETASRIAEGIFAPRMKGSNVMPLLARLGKILEAPDVGIFKHPAAWLATLADFAEAGMRSGPALRPDIQTNDPAILKEILKIAEESGGFGRSSQFPPRLLELLQRGGYNTIAYPNMTQEVAVPGEISYMLTNPRQLRSVFESLKGQLK